MTSQWSVTVVCVMIAVMAVGQRRDPSPISLSEGQCASFLYVSNTYYPSMEYGDCTRCLTESRESTMTGAYKLGSSTFRSTHVYMLRRETGRLTQDPILSPCNIIEIRSLGLGH